MRDIARSARAFAGGFFLLLLAASACAPVPAKAPHSPASQPPPPRAGSAGPMAGLESQLFVFVNTHRTAIGARPLTQDPRLSEIARAHSREMADGTTGFGHDGYSQRAARVLGQKRRSFAENVAKSTRPTERIAEAMIRGWLRSAVHRRNIEGAFTASGIGVARDKRGTTYITQIFAGD